MTGGLQEGSEPLPTPTSMADTRYQYKRFARHFCSLFGPAPFSSPGAGLTLAPSALVRYARYVRVALSVQRLARWSKSVGQNEDIKRALMVAYQRAAAHREVHPAPRPEASLQQLRASLDIELPARGRSGEEVITALADAAEAGLIGISSPHFYGWVMGATHPVGVAADWLTAAWGQNAGLFHTSPAAAVAEEAVTRWILQVLELPASASVGMVTGATMANFVGLAAGRSEVLHRLGYDIEAEGFNGAPSIQVLLGAEAHSSVDAALRYLGFGQARLVRIPADEQGRMKVDSLADALATHEGPTIVIAQAGHINSGAFDPLQEIAGLCRTAGAWLHVDGAFGLWARAAPALKQLCVGADLADSWAVDGHKWLQTPYDSGFAIVRDPLAHQRAMSVGGSYLNQAPGDAHNPCDLVPELSRRARGFAIWAVMQALGRDGIAEMITRHCDCAGRLQHSLSQVPGISVLNDVELNQLALVFGDTQDGQQIRDGYTRQVIDKLQAENLAFTSGAQWRGHWIMRVSIISQATDLHHIQELAEAIKRAWKSVQSEVRR